MCGRYIGFKLFSDEKRSSLGRAHQSFILMPQLCLNYSNINICSPECLE